MKELELAATGRITTQLGYGCSGIMGALSQRDSIALLEAAFASGIRHFDVAPLYGFGAAEACLGQFLQRHRNEVTVTTKFGLPPAKNRRLLASLRGVVKPLIDAVPPLKKHLAVAANKAAGTGARVPFTPQAAMASLDSSLRALRTDRVDLFLLHEAAADDLFDDALLDALRRAEEAGKIGGFGVGSDASKVEALLHERPGFCRVLQFDWSVLQAPVMAAGSFQVHHRCLGEAFRSVQQLLARSRETSARWSVAAGVDLDAPGVLARVMMRAALDQNPDGLLLFSSRNPHHMATNVEVASDAKWAAPAARWVATLLHEGTARQVPEGATADLHPPAASAFKPVH